MPDRGIPLYLLLHDWPLLGGADRMARLIAGGDSAERPAMLAHSDEMIELLVDGFVFELHFGAAMRGAERHVATCRTLFCRRDEVADCVAVGLRLGREMDHAAGLETVVKAMLRLAQRLAARAPVRALCWLPGGNCIDARQFSLLVDNYLLNGTFPVLALIGMDDRGDDGLLTQGLGWFCGQEVAIGWARNGAGSGDGGAALTERLVRVIHDMVASGPIDKPCRMAGMVEDETVRFVPNGDGLVMATVEPGGAAADAGPMRKRVGLR